jgi:hypothetical protein
MEYDDDDDELFLNLPFVTRRHLNVLSHLAGWEFI